MLSTDTEKRADESLQNSQEGGNVNQETERMCRKEASRGKERAKHRTKKAQVRRVTNWKARPKYTASEKRAQDLEF